jgi:LPS export ABC transporter protein LptC
VTLLLFLTAACSKEDKTFVKSFEDRSKVSGMFTDSTTTLISDSGKIRYKIYTKKWIIYDKAKEPYWYFPQKFHFEMFNDSMLVASSMDCDTARYDIYKKLWVFKKNVRFINLKGDLFETQLLYWDQRSQKMYSDSFIRIEQKDYILSGYGFESNQTFTKYHIMKPSGPIDLDAERPDSISMDPSAQQASNPNGLKVVM